MSTPVQNRQFSPFQPGISPDTRASNPQQFASNAQGYDQMYGKQAQPGIRPSILQSQHLSQWPPGPPQSGNNLLRPSLNDGYNAPSTLPNFGANSSVPFPSQQVPITNPNIQMSTMPSVQSYPANFPRPMAGSVPGMRQSNSQNAMQTSTSTGFASRPVPGNPVFPPSQPNVVTRTVRPPGVPTSGFVPTSQAVSSSQQIFDSRTLVSQNNFASPSNLTSLPNGPQLVPGLNTSIVTNGPSNTAVISNQAEPSFMQDTSSLHVAPSVGTVITSDSNEGISQRDGLFQSSANEARPGDLPIPFQGHAQYSHQVRGHGDGLTPSSSEPASHRSTPIDTGPLASSQQFDNLEGQFTPSAGVPSMQQSAGQWSVTHGQETHKPSIVSGRRQYPQMQANATFGQQVRPVIPPPLPGSVQQPAVPLMPTQPAQAAPAAGLRMHPTAPGARMFHPQQPGGSYPQPPGGNYPQQPGSNYPQQPGGNYPQQPGGNYPQQSGGNYPQQSGVNYLQQPLGSHSTPQPQSLATNFANMNIQDAGSGVINLMVEKNLIPPDGVELPTPSLPAEWKRSLTNPDLFRCTLNAVPNSQSLLNKSRLPLGLILHPFKDLTQLPVIQSSIIVRCRSCRTYINPFIQFLDSRRWKCNLCFRANELPEEFSYDPASKTYGDPQRRPEIKSSTIEFIAPSEYMLRPPQPAIYLFMFDVSFCAIETGYLTAACKTILECLDRLPGDSRTQIGFITFDHAVHFYSLGEGSSQHQMFVVSDIDDIFLPCPDGLLVNLIERKDQIIDLLNKLPEMFAKNMEPASALGAALQAAYKLMSGTGGRVTTFLVSLPSVGPGSLKSREDPNERSGKVVQNLGPATDFYKKLALECNAQQIAVDLFFLSGQYCDMASIGGIAKYSGGSVHYFPNYHSIKNTVEVKRFESTLTRYLTRKIGFEAVMRIRCTRGLNIHTFHGNFFVRSTDLLALPNINPDAGFGMQMAIEDNLECSHVCFQVALLYTSSKGERRIRVHTLCLPVTNQLSEVHNGADQLAIVALLAKMASDRSVQQSVGDAREALINAAVDMLTSFGSTLVSSQRVGQLPCPRNLRLIPLYVLALSKYTAFRVGVSTRLDDRLCALENCKTLPLPLLMQAIHPDLYAIHNLEFKGGLGSGDDDDAAVPQPPLLSLTAASIDRHGVYLMDTGVYMYVWVGAAISDKLCQEIFDKPNFQALPEIMVDLPDLETPISELISSFIAHLNEQKPQAVPVIVIREDSRQRMLFLQYLIQDRTESSHSYYEFLQHLQKEVKV